MGFRILTLSPPSPYIFVPNLFASKLGFCYDPYLPIWANDPNSALFCWQASLTRNIAEAHGARCIEFYPLLIL